MGEYAGVQGPGEREGELDDLVRGRHCSGWVWIGGVGVCLWLSDARDYEKLESCVTASVPWVSGCRSNGVFGSRFSPAGVVELHA